MSSYPKFHIGQRVRCIEPNGILIRHKHYIISYIEDEYVGVDGRESTDYYATRFIPAVLSKDSPIGQLLNTGD